MHGLVAMVWVRTRRRWGGWLALAALMLQLALSFGHVHAEDMPVRGGAVAVQTAGGGNADGSDDKHHRHGDCAVCVAIHIAATGLASKPPRPAMPALYAPSWLTVSDVGPTAPKSRQPFQARAPPQG